MGAHDHSYEKLQEFASSTTIGWGKEAAAAIIQKLESSGEDPQVYRIKWLPDPSASKLSFSIVHMSTLEPKHDRVIGNPSGNDRIAIYDINSNKVEFSFVQ